MAQSQVETLYDYKDALEWVKKLKWNGSRLRRIPVHRQQTDRQPFLSLREMSPHGLATLFVYKNEVPEDIWEALSNTIANLGPASGFEQQGMEGTDVWEAKKGHGRAG